jgi:hypothetical protein
MQIPCVYIPGPAPAVTVANTVFFIKQLLLVPVGKPRDDFKFFGIFRELIVFVIDSLAMNTPGESIRIL